MKKLTAVLLIAGIITLACSSNNPVTVVKEDPGDGVTGIGGSGTTMQTAAPALTTDFIRQPINQYFGDTQLSWVGSMASGTGGNLFKLENLEVVETYAGDNGTGYLNMTVTANKLEGAEITTFPSTLEYHYGTYSCRMKPSPIAGCINAFFTKNFTGFNDEIDIEFLTNTFGGGKGQVEYTLHPHVGASGSQYHRVINLSFDPSQAFHEYTFVWTYDQIEYLIDGNSITTFKRSEGAPIQTHAGTIMLNVWVSANPAWGGGPPTSDATMNVDWIKYWPEGSSSIKDEPAIVLQ